MLSRWLLLILCILLGGANVIRGVAGCIVSSSHVVQTIPLPLLSALYLLWGGVFLTVGIITYRGMRPNGRRPIVVTALLYQIMVWIVHIIGDRSSNARNLWGRDLVLSGAFLLVVVLLAQDATRRIIRGNRNAPVRSDEKGSDD